MPAPSLINWVESHTLTGYRGLAEILVFMVAAAYLHAIVQDFLQTFLKKPAHFAPVSWKSWLYKPKAAVPTVPVVNNDYPAALEEGTRMYPDRPYKLKHFSDEVVIVPQKDAERIRTTPESKLSFQQASYDFFMGHFTGITGHDNSMSSLIRKDIARLVDRVYDIVEDEAGLAVEKEIGPCEDWTPVVLLPKVVRIIINISQRVFVGDQLCRNEKWVKTITECTAGAFMSVPVLWHYNRLTRPFAAWRNPALRNIRKHREEAKGLLKPILDQRLADMEKPDFKPPPDLIQLVIDGTKGKGRSLDYQVNAQIGTGRASLFTTGVTISHLIYDLCAHPEFIEPLREEVLALGDAKMNRATVAKLEKMDSFIRECQRWNKFLLVGTIRKVLTPLELSDGTVLPIGTLMGLNTQEAVFKHTTLENPEVFDGLRFYKLRLQPGNESKFQAVSTGPDHLVFGYGPQACPGRFFAVHEAKVVLSRILARYDFKLAKPVGSPMNRAVGIMTQADGTVEYLFKRRTN